MRKHTWYPVGLVAMLMAVGVGCSLRGDESGDEDGSAELAQIGMVGATGTPGQPAGSGGPGMPPPPSGGSGSCGSGGHPPPPPPPDGMGGAPPSGSGNPPPPPPPCAPGQTEKCLYKRLVAPDTVDERIEALLAEKKDLLSQLQSMSLADIFSIV